MIKETFIYGIDNFYELKENCWSGAIQTLDRVEELGKQDEFLELLNDIIASYEENGIEETKLNDYIWFDAENDFKEFKGIDLWEEEVL